MDALESRSLDVGFEKHGYLEILCQRSESLGLLNKEAATFIMRNLILELTDETLFVEFENRSLYTNSSITIDGVINFVMFKLGFYHYFQCHPRSLELDSLSRQKSQKL